MTTNNLSSKDCTSFNTYHSCPINIPSTPSLPPIGYYDTSGEYKRDNSYNFLKDKLNETCGKIGSTGIFTKHDTAVHMPTNATALDVPYYLALNGHLHTGSDSTYSAGTSQEEIIATSLTDAVSTAVNKDNQAGIVNQIQYLACQLVNARNRMYDHNEFKLLGNNTTVKDIFNNFSGSKIYLILIFILTMYFLVNGIFSSFDVVGNIFGILEKNATYTVNYWLGLLLGLAFPIILLCSLYVNIVCKSLDKENTKYEITTNPDGTPTTIPSSVYQIDYNILILFIIILYAFSAVLFTIKRKELGNTLYLSIVGLVLTVLSIFIYLLYIYIPFFSTGDSSAVNATPPRRLFVDTQNEVSDIYSNQHQNDKINKSFIITFVVMFIGAILFLGLGKKMKGDSIFKDFANGLLGSSAILVIPVIWVFNFIIAINYFYIYPIILIGARFLRYFGMLVLWFASEKSDSLKDNFSEGLIKDLENFKDYSPTWGLLGIDVLKGLMNIIGYDNVFSGSIISNDDMGKNLSQNKFVGSGFLNFLVNFDKNGIIYSGIVFIITILISVTILYGVVKI